MHATIFLAHNDYKGNSRCFSLVNFIDNKKFTIEYPHLFHLQEQKHFNPRIKFHKAVPENPKLFARKNRFSINGVTKYKTVLG